MPWTYKENPPSSIVEVTVIGEITSDDLQELTSTLIELEKEKGSNGFLIDTTQMEFAASIVDLYKIPAIQYIEEGADRLACVAVILSDSIKEKEAVEFYETASINRGWNVRAFSERQEAIEWLADETASKNTDSADGL